MLAEMRVMAALIAELESKSSDLKLEAEIPAMTANAAGDDTLQRKLQAYRTDERACRGALVALPPRRRHPLPRIPALPRAQPRVRLPMS